jgi:histone-lysine N-methyltransferase SETMAR
MQFEKKRSGQLSRGVLLHHDNARPHTAGATQKRIQELQWEVLEHTPYSPDLAPSDFHLFGRLKKHFGGKCFGDDEEAETEVQKWLRQQSKDFCSAGFVALVKRWDKCNNVGGGYVKRYIFFSGSIITCFTFHILTLPHIINSYVRRFV